MATFGDLIISSSVYRILGAVYPGGKVPICFGGEQKKRPSGRLAWDARQT